MTVVHGEVVVEGVSFLDLEDGLVARATEYWVTQGHETPPDWRASLAERW